MTHLEGIGSVTGVEQAVSRVVAHREARPEVGPEDGLVVRGVDVLVLVLNVTDPYPEALGGTRHIAVDQLIDFLTSVSPVFTSILTLDNNGSLLGTVEVEFW